MSTFTEPENETYVGFDIPVELHVLDKTNRIVAARIRRVSHSLFELSCSEQLQKGQKLALSHEEKRLAVEVFSAEQSVTDVYFLAVKVVAEKLGEVRSELRLPTDIPATLRVAGATAEMTVRIVDMSPSGMCIEVPVALSRGAKVCVSLDQGLAFGEIRFSRQKAQGIFSAGFLLEEYICQNEPHDL